MEGKRVLVTGGAGFIGSHLVERLGARNEVTVLDDLSTGSLRNLAAVSGELHVKRASILDTDVVAPAMAGQDLVYHLAAKTSVPESIAKPDAYWRTNVEGTLTILKAAADARVRRVVFTSSAAVYGTSEVNPKVETMRPAHTSPRIAHKRPRDGDIRHSLADIGKAREKLGFRPRTSLREGLEKTLAFFRTEGTPA